MCTKRWIQVPDYHPKCDIEQNSIIYIAYMSKVAPKLITCGNDVADVSCIAQWKNAAVTDTAQCRVCSFRVRWHMWASC